MKYLHFTRWLLLAVCMIAGNIGLNAQLTATIETECICPSEPGGRTQDRITIDPGGAGDTVFILSYPLMLPSSVLWREAEADNSFYLDGDDEDKHLDTLTTDGSIVTFTSWRNGNQSFPLIVFSNGTTTDTVSFSVCSATVDDAIEASQFGFVTDTVCLNNAMMDFALPIGLSIDSVRWSAFANGGVMTGSLVSTSIGNSPNFSHEFLEAGDHTVSAQGATLSSCPINDTIAIHVIDTDFEIEGFDFACAGDAVPFNMSSGFSTGIFDTVTWTITSMSGNGTYTFLSDSTDVGNINIQFDSADTYTIMVEADKTTGSIQTLCQIFDSHTITIAQTLGAGIVGDTVVCVNNVRGYKANVNMLQDITWTSAQGNILGSSTSDSVTVSFTNAGLDTLKAVGVTAGGCMVLDSIIIDIKDSQITLAGDTALCLGQTAGYRAMYTDASVASFTTINWSVVPMNPANDTSTFTALTEGDSLQVTWGAIGDYMIVVEGVTDLGCNLNDQFMVSVQDTNQFIQGPTLVCAGDIVEYNLLQSFDSSSVISSSIDWEVFRFITDTNEVDEAIIDIDGDGDLFHSFTSGTISKSGFYIVVAGGTTANGCSVTDTLRVEVIGNTDLAIESINSTGTYCAGGVFDFRLVLDDTLQTSSLNWTAFQKSNNAPVIPSAIDQSKGDTVTIDFPNVADTFIVQVTGTAGPSCMYTVQHEIVITDSLYILNADNLDTLCLTGDSTWYAVNIDTGDINLASVTWSITNNAGGGAIFPAMTGSGTSFLSVAYAYPGPGIYTHRVRGMENGTGCEFDETLMVTVKDTLYFIDGDKQICLGDTTEYALLDALMMPLGDFPPGDSLNWLVGANSVLGDGPVMTGSQSALGYSFSEFSGPINDTLRIVWAVGGEQVLSVSDSTLCCPINVRDTILVRDMDFQLEGPLSVCVGDTTGYKITNFNGSAIDDLVADSTSWSVQRGTVLDASSDSLTINWNLTDAFINTTDTIIFSGYTNDGCAVHDTIVVNIRNRDFVILGDMNVCQGDSVHLSSIALFNAVDSSTVDDIDSLYWIFSAGNDTIKLDSTILNVFVDSDSTVQETWTEQGTFTIKAIGYTNGTCKVESEFIVVVNENPNPVITGDVYTCVNGTDTYSIDIDMTNVASVTWTVGPFAGTPDAGTIVSGQGTTEIVVSWGAIGDYLVTVTGFTNGGCMFTHELSPITVVGAASIGQLACNNDINVTLPDNCELMLTPGQILQDQDPLIPDDEYEIIVEDAASGTILSNGLVDASLLGMELKVIITHECSGQTCWGYITLEDKTIPELLCASDTIPCTSSIDPLVLGFPVPDDATVTETSSNPPLYDVVGFEKCGTAILTYNDRTSSEVCEGDYGTIIYRDWKMTNHAGLMSTCTDTILIERVNIDSLDLTGLKNFVGDEGFECHLVTREELNPGTRTGNLSVVTSDLCFNVQATFSDVDSPFCGENSYRITRTWTILDWCTGKVRTHTQKIDVLDREGPVITLDRGDINISATDHTCSGDYNMSNDITVLDRCSNPVSTTVRIFENNALGALLHTITNDDYSGLAFDPDVTRIFIDVQSTDACGRSNQDTVSRNITITDDVKPIPICDESTTISIGAQGWAIANWHAFDDGSLDNCGIEKIEIRRMENNCTDFPENLVFGEYVKFCCEDARAGLPILVQLRVTDVNGNVNECMVSVTVQDNSSISKRPLQNTSETISCNDPIEDILDPSNVPVTFLTGVCGIPKPPTELTPIVDTTSCGTGTITRRWFITDELGNSLGHEHVITIGLPGETFDPADLVNIWPADYTGEGCAGPNTSPDALPAQFRPNIDLEGYACSSLGLDHEDLIFRDVEGLCAKVLRTWTLYDWCQRDPLDPNSGKWEYVQILRLTDTVDPVISTGCETETFAANSANSCSASVSTSATADDCHDNEDLVWTFSIVDSDGTTVLEGNRNTISTILEIGTYTVTWTATDPCGNSDTCDKELRVLDTQEPNAIFRDITRVIAANGITVDASEVLLRVTDNCSDESEITYHFNTVDGPSSLDFDCASMLGMDFRSIHPDIYAVDASGNAFKGHVNITLEDVNNVCDGNSSGGEGMVAGQIYTGQDYTIDEVEVTLTTMNTGASTFEMTPVEGEYAFENVPMDATYEVSAKRDDDYLNGVSTLDLLLIQRHILGLRDLDSPYRVIAADVDGSDHVSAIDLVHLRRLILGLAEEFPIGKPWTFVDASQTFDDERRPFPYSEKHTLSNFNQDQLDMDFVGVKLGDVNGNVQLQSVLLGITRSIESISINEVSNSENEMIVGLTPNSAASIAGMQLGIGLLNDVEVSRVFSNQVEIEDDNYTVINNELRISWNSIEAIDITEDALIYVAFKTSGSGNSLEDMITLSNNHITSEIYTEANGDIEISDVFLEFGDEAGLGFVVEQNVPNPFNGTSLIKFFQPNEGDVEFTISDLSGRQVKNVTNFYSKGWHELNVSTEDLPSSGIYIYQMSNGTEVIRKKMITID